MVETETGAYVAYLRSLPAAGRVVALELIDASPVTHRAAVEQLALDPELAWAAPLLAGLLSSVERNEIVYRALTTDLRESLGLPRRRLEVVPGTPPTRPRALRQHVHPPEADASPRLHLAGTPSARQEQDTVGSVRTLGY
jgi:hypothetical protein